MSRSRYSRGFLLGEDTASTTIATPDATVTVTPNADPDSLDLTPPGTELPAGEPDIDPAIEAIIRSLESDDAATIIVDQPGGDLGEPDCEPDEDDLDAHEEIADATADAVNDSADEVAVQFEQAEQRLLLAEDIGAYGLSASGLLIGRQLGLLSGASFDGMSRESLEMAPIVAGSRAAVMSQESLISSGAEKVAEIGSRALSHSSGVIRRLIGMATAEEKAIRTLAIARKGALAAEKSQMVRATGEAASSGLRGVIANAGKAAIRPRNAAIALAVVGAIAGVAKLVPVVLKGAPAPGTPVGEMNAWFGKVKSQISGIKWPFGKLELKATATKATSTMRDKIGRLFCKGRPVVGAEDAVRGFAEYRIAAKEWTKESLDAFTRSFGEAMNALKTSLTGGGEGFIRNITSGFKGVVPEGAGRSAVVLSRGGYITAVFGVLAILASVIYFVVAGGCRIIRKQLRG